MAKMEDDRSIFKILTGKPIGKRSLGRPRHIKTYFKVIVVNTRKWIYSAQDGDLLGSSCEPPLNLRVS